MKSRREFLKQSSMVMGGLAATAVIPSCFTAGATKAGVPMKTRKIEKPLVLWYSQTGYTQRTGRLLQKTFEGLGLNATGSDIRDFNPVRIGEFDLIVLGSPVFYYDTPRYVKDWIEALPDLKGIPAAAFVTFGGPEGNQHNAACSILEGLVTKQGVPIGMQAFMNMSSFPLAWSKDKVHEKTWMSRHLPNEDTYRAVRDFAGYLVHQVEKGQALEFSKKITLRECSTWLAPIFWTKLFVKHHSIDEKKCIRCGACVEKCPAGAIDLSGFKVDANVCVLCFGCINNCPAGAVHMEYDGEKVIGYHDFMKRKQLKIIEPDDQLEDVGTSVKFGF